MICTIDAQEGYHNWLIQRKNSAAQFVEILLLTTALDAKVGTALQSMSQQQTSTTEETIYSLYMPW